MYVLRDSCVTLCIFWGPQLLRECSVLNQNVDCCEHGIDPVGSLKVKDFLNTARRNLLLTYCVVLQMIAMII